MLKIICGREFKDSLVCLSDKYLYKKVDGLLNRFIKISELEELPGILGACYEFKVIELSRTKVNLKSL